MKSEQSIEQKLEYQAILNRDQNWKHIADRKTQIEDLTKKITACVSVGKKPDLFDSDWVLITGILNTVMGDLIMREEGMVV